MIPLRVTMPRMVKKPTSEPSEMMPPKKYTATAPPTSAVGQVRNDSSARRKRLKTTMRSTKIPAAAMQREGPQPVLRLWRSMYSPSTSAW